MGGLTMVMAPTQLSSSAVPRKRNITRSTRQKKLEEYVPIPTEETETATSKRAKLPVVRKTASTTSSLSSTAPRRGRSAATSKEVSEPVETISSTKTRAGKRKQAKTVIKEVLEVSNDDTDADDKGEEEEDDGFAFRRKVPKATKANSATTKASSTATMKKTAANSTDETVKPLKAPKATARTTRSKKQIKLDYEEPLEEPPVESPKQNGRTHSLTNGKSKENGSAAPSKVKKPPAKKRVTKKKKAEPIPEVKSIEFNFEGLDDYPGPNGQALDSQRPPIPKHKSHNPFINNSIPDNAISTYSNTSFQHPLMGEFRDEANVPLYSPEAATPPRIGVKSQQISLPLSDTPIIRKNQEMRKKQSGVRRSSLGNRGKRASSIGNGFVAVPHSEVSPKDFYKHLDADMPEPHRMKQLLLWSLKRVMETQEETYKQIKLNPAISAEDSAAIRVARFIQEEIVRDVAEGRISTSWWNRPEDSDLTETVKKPNVQNVTNKRNYEAFEKRYNGLLKEQEQWKNKLEEVRKAASELSLPPSLSSNSHSNSAAIPELEILKEYPILGQSQPDNSTSATLGRLQTSLNEMEQEVDRLDDFTHRAGAVSKAATIFSANQMSRLKKHVEKSRLMNLDPRDSILSSLVQASEAHKKKTTDAGDDKLQDPSSSSSSATDNTKSQVSPPVGTTTADGVPIRDILRTITRLERNSP